MHELNCMKIKTLYFFRKTNYIIEYNRKFARGIKENYCPRLLA